MKCWGCLKLDLLLLPVNTWFYSVIQSCSVRQIQTFVICVDTCPTKHRTALLGELGSELFCTSIFQPWIINRCLEVGLSVLMHLINTNSPFFPFCLYKSILREQKNSSESFFPPVRIVSQLFSMCWGLFWFSFVLRCLLWIYIFAVPLNLQAVAWLLKILCCSWKII